MATKKKRLLLKIFLVVCVLTPVVLGIGYFVVTSSFFIRSVILPYAGRAVGVELSARQISIQPFAGKANIQGLSAGPADAPILQCANLSLQCDLFSLPGHIRIEELTISDVSVKLSADRDGKWNLPLLNKNTLSGDAGKSHKAPPVSQRKTRRSDIISLPDIDIKNIEMRNINAEISSDSPGGKMALSVRELNFKLENLSPGKNAAMLLQGGLKLDKPGIAIRDCALNAAVKLQLNERRIPCNGVLDITASGLQGNIGDLDLTDNTITLTGQLESGTDGSLSLKSLSLKQNRKDVTISRLDLSSAGTLTPLHQNFTLSATQLPPFLLKLAERHLRGYKLGQVGITANGSFSFDDGTVATAMHTIVTHQPDGRSAGQLPPIKLELNHDFDLNTQKHQLAAKTLRIELQESGNSVFALYLSAPFTWDLNGQPQAQAEYPALDMNIRKLPLPQLNLLLPPNYNFASGELRGHVKTVFDSRENRIMVKGIMETSGLALAVRDGGKISMDMYFDVNGNIRQMDNWELSSLDVRLSQRADNIAGLSLRGSGRLSEQTCRFTVETTDLSERTVSQLPPAFPGRPAIAWVSGILKPFSLSLRSAGEFDMQKKQLSIADTQVTLDRGNHGRLTVALTGPVTLDREVLQLPLPIKVQADRLNLVFVNGFLPPGTRIFSGALNAGLNCRMALKPQSLQVSGEMNFSNFHLRSGNLDFSELDTTHVLNIDLSDDYRMIRIGKLESCISKAHRMALQMNNSGEINVSTGSLSFDNRIIYANEMLAAIFMKAPPQAVFRLSGDLSYAMSEKYSRQTAQGKLSFNELKVPSLNRPVNAEIAFDVRPEGKLLRVHKFSSNITDGKNRITDLNVTGKVALPLSAGKSEIFLNSTCLDLLLLKEIATPAAPAVNAPDQPGPAVPQSGPPPAPQPLKLNADAIVRLDLDGITYGPEMKMSCRKSEIILNGNMVNVSPLNLDVNGAPVKIVGAIELGVPNGYPFDCRVDFTNMNIVPLIHTFKPDLSGRITGTVNNFQTKLKGRGFSAPELNRNLNGDISFETANLSFPNSMRDMPLTQSIFIALEIFSKLTQYVPNLASSNDLSQAIDQAGKIGNSTNNLNLKTGKVNINIAQGCANLKEFSFTGDFIKSFTASGYIPLEKTRPMKLTTNLDVGYLVMPLDIGGTPASPEPNITQMVAGMVTGNFNNILQSTPIRKILQTGEAQGVNLLQTGEKILTEGIFGPRKRTVNNNQQKSQESQKNDSLKKETNTLINDIMNL